MLAAVQILMIGLTLLSLIGLVLGLFKPVLVLWFLDRFNRMKVLQIYGAFTVVFIVFWYLLNFLID